MQQPSQTNANSNSSPSPRLSLRTSNVDGRFHLATQATAIENTTAKPTAKQNLNSNVTKPSDDEMDVDDRPHSLYTNRPPPNANLTVTPKPHVPTASSTSFASSSSATQQKEAVGQSLFNRSKKRERPVTMHGGLASSGSMPHSTASSGQGLGTSGHGGGQTAFIEYFEQKKEAKPRMNCRFYLRFCVVVCLFVIVLFDSLIVCLRSIQFYFSIFICTD
jgi:hypothetical protein